MGLPQHKEYKYKQSSNFLHIKNEDIKEVGLQTPSKEKMKI